MYDAYCIIHTWDTRMILKLCLQKYTRESKFYCGKKSAQDIITHFCFFLKNNF